MTHLKGICRCCLSEGKFKSMQCAPLTSCSQSFAEMLNDVLGHPLYHAAEVQLICGTCSNKLCQAFAFRKQVKSAEIAFLAQLQQQVTDIKIEIKQENVGDCDVKIPVTKTETITYDKLSQSMIVKEDSALIIQKLWQHRDNIQVHNTVTSACTTETKNTVSAISNQPPSEKAESEYCDKCEKHFPDKISFKHHVSMCRRTCHSCKTCFRTINILQRHKVAAHNAISSVCTDETKKIVSAISNRPPSEKERSVYCDKCEKHFRDKKNYKGHMSVCKRTCHSCKTCFKRVDILQRHKVAVHREGFVCNICDYTYTTEFKLVRHQRQTHMREKNVKCAHCEFEAFDKSLLAKHMRSHYDVRPYECKTCKKKFKNSSTRNFHERIHTGDKRQVCQLCGEKYVQRASLKYHLEKHHPGEVY